MKIDELKSELKEKQLTNREVLICMILTFLSGVIWGYLLL
jgi:hypothetical protein